MLARLHKALQGLQALQWQLVVLALELGQALQVQVQVQVQEGHLLPSQLTPSDDVHLYGHVISL